MKKALPPPLADKKKQVAENEDAQDSKKEKIIPEELYAYWILMHDAVTWWKENQ